MFGKQLFFITNDQLRAHAWQGGQLGPGHSFGSDEAGTQAFGAWLARHRDRPAYVVADVIEEDFQRHLLPHVGGRAGEALRERRLGQLFRDTPFRHATVQGREREGRRDDIVLLSALTNPAPITHWLGLIEAHAVPLAALYSSALLSKLLVDKFGLARPHLLLVTQQLDGLRESYFQGAALKFSRLTTLAEQAGAEATLLAEVSKTRQFLTSTHLLEREEGLEVVIIAMPASIATLEAHCQDSAEVAWRFIGTADTADRILLERGARRTPPGHYQTGAAGRFYPVWQARLALRLATLALVTLGFGWTASNVWRAVMASEQDSTLRQETRQFTLRYAQASKDLPANQAAPVNMRAAVQIEQMLSQDGPTPATLLATLSAALDQVPQVELRQLDWQVEPPSTVPTSRSLGLGARARQSLRVEADLALDQGNYRAAFDAMNQLVRLLAATPGVQVDIVTAPLELGPDTRLSGKVGAAPLADRAGFTLAIGWTP